MINTKLDLLKYIKEPLYIIRMDLGSHVHEELFTRIPWRDFKRIKHAQLYLSIPQQDLEDQVFRDYVRPVGKYDLKDVENLPAGVVKTVFDLIYELSDSGTFPNEEGDLDLESLTRRFNYQRIQVRSQIVIQLMTTICAVFKGYTFETLELLSFDKIMQLFAAAEKHMLDVGALEDFINFIPTEDPDAPKDPPLDGRDEAFNDLIEESKKAPEPRSQKPVQQDASQEEAFMATLKDFQASQDQKKEEPSRLNLGEDPKPKERVNIPLIKPTPINKNHPDYDKLVRFEQQRVDILNKARLTGVSQSSKRIAPPQREVNAGGVGVTVGNIDYSSNVSQQDYGPAMTDEEALAEAVSGGLIPAGYEIMLMKKDQQQESKKNTLSQEYAKRVDGRGKISLRERKQIKAQLKEEGFI